MLLFSTFGVVAGPFDLIGIVKNTKTGRFHAYVWEESPLPGGDNADSDVVRLKSRMHHTEGAETFERALEHVADLRKKIQIKDANVRTAEVMKEKDFSEEGFADVMLLSRWK